MVYSMAIGNVTDKVSEEDIQKLDNLQNPPEYEPGFEGSLDEDEDDFGFFSSTFDDMAANGELDLNSDGTVGGLWGGTNNNTSGAGNNSSNSNFGFGSTQTSAPSGMTSFGGTPSIGGQSNQAGGGLYDSFGTTINLGQSALNTMGGQTQQAVQKQPGVWDKIFELSGIGVTHLGKVLLQMIKSTKLRTADDWGYYGKKLIDISIIVSGIGILMWFILGKCLGSAMFKFTGLPLTVFGSGIITLGSGFIFLGLAAYRIDKLQRMGINNVDAIPELPQQVEGGMEAYENDVSSLLAGFDDEDDDFFGFDESGDDEFEGLFESEDDDDLGFDSEDGSLDFGFGDISNSESSTGQENDENKKVTVDLEKAVDNVQANVPIMSRKLLLDTFIPLFPKNTEGFADRKQIDKNSREFKSIQTLCLEALASAGRFESSEELAAKYKLVSAYETFFTYELKVDRVKGLNKLEDIEREMVAYFRESSSDTSVTCKVDLEGKLYKIVLNKGVSAVVTFGDLFSLPEVRSYFEDTKKALPIIAGIGESGDPILADAKLYDTMLIAGKPRSGKSWYVLNLMLSMMAFNTPDDVQFLIIDPKESNLFKTLALMPHVCGLHNDDNILNIFRDIIEYEGARRKKLLADNKCENIWDLRKKGVMVPILYIVIDEVMTVIANLDSQSKAFFDQMKVVVSQLPSQGIRLLFVPHRSQGVVDKTIRTNIGFTAAVRAEPEVIKETLDIKSWNTPLLNPGDTALKMQGFGREMFVHGPAVTASDTDNTDLIITMAKMFYKMGVSMPDMSTIGCGYNKDMKKVREELGETSTSSKVQFDINDVSDIDLGTEEECSLGSISLEK